jgi:hypothetical protein
MEGPSSLRSIVDLAPDTELSAFGARGWGLAAAADPWVHTVEGGV